MVKPDTEDFDLFPECEVFQRTLGSRCEFNQFYYDWPLCCLKRETSKPYCNKDDCPKDKGIKECKPYPKLCADCPTNPKNKRVMI